jgi:hypothetical protein
VKKLVERSFKAVTEIQGGRNKWEENFVDDAEGGYSFPVSN